MNGTTTIQKSDLENYTKALLQELSRQADSDKATVVTLTGDLGAGKTTLVQTLAKQLEVAETVTSPTFVVMKSYPIDHPSWDSLVHIDAYRFEDPEEVLPLNLPTLFTTPRTLVCIEWPDKLGQYLPVSHHSLMIAVDEVSEDTRHITYEYQ